jgi:small subunit ribosomal protein S16
MLVLRLLRIGKNNQPSYKVVVTQKTNPARGGRFVEQVGTYNPVTKERKMDKERIQYWLSKGVQPSATIHNFLIKDGILSGNKIAKHKKSKKPAVAAAPAAVKPAEAPAAPQPAAPAAEAPATPEAAPVAPAAEAPKAPEAKEEAPKTE